MRTLVARLRAGLEPDADADADADSAVAAAGWRLMPSETAIQPLLIGENVAALALMARLREQGLWVPAIRWPTVPAGTARLRISLSAAHRIEAVDSLLNALRTAARAL